MAPPPRHDKIRDRGHSRVEIIWIEGSSDVRDMRRAQSGVGKLGMLLGAWQLTGHGGGQSWEVAAGGHREHVR